MVKRPLKLREKTISEDEPDPAAAESPKPAGKTEASKAEPEIQNRQKRREELGRYWLQVDRQTKGSYASLKDAEAAGMAIKTKFAQVQVAIYDRDESSNRVLELPA